MELQMKAICEGSTTRRAVLEQSIAQYKQVFLQSQEQVGVLKQVSNKTDLTMFLGYKSPFNNVYMDI
jgi:hypothetical protein